MLRHRNNMVTIEEEVTTAQQGHMEIILK